MNCGSFSIYYIGCGDEEPVGDAMKNMFNRRGMIELLHVSIYDLVELKLITSEATRHREG